MSKIIKEWASFAAEIALLAGDILKKGFGSQFIVDSKPGKQNLVTEYDRASENLITTAIKSRYPTHSIIAEESGSYIKQESQVTWIIDPLDGTVNFAHEIPLFSISIAVAIHKEIVCGVVYQPMTKELFVAQKQQGAFLNGRLLSISSVSQMSQALLATGFPYDVHKDPLHCIESFSEISRTGTPIRRLGSAAIDLAYVAAGRFDGFWEAGLNSWDMAAGMLLVKEAGGTVTHYDGKEHQIFGYYNLLATNKHLHPIMINYLKQR
ncbi:MAG TPA: inositol monophosphatase family protein [Candidatus Rhabdochlamydia sp.]|jgi:myo-inositol-1(or 4)-monophosphatase|nr:inositol monophosphatase family protein [Candidatus Rhabdochlamydia sp.]